MELETWVGGQMPKTPKYRTGDTVGHWVLTGPHPLGQGGSAEVWEARDSRDEGRPSIAVKILRSHSDYLYERFRREIAFLEKLGPTPGILPMLGSNLAATPSKSDPAWLAMPIADPLEGALSSSEERLDAVLRAISEIAETLVTVHGLGHAHRDIKPGNLYRFGGRATIGDFGLVELPYAEPLTGNDRQLGPAHFYAPEMLRDPAGSEGKRADVYSLAKTFWVLATNQRYPPEGDVRIDIPQIGLRSYVADSRAIKIDRLIDRCTRRLPSERPTMEEFAAELRAIGTSPPLNVEAGIDVIDLLDGLADDAAVMQAIDRRKDDSRGARLSIQEEGLRILTTIHDEIGTKAITRLDAEATPLCRELLKLDLNGVDGYGGTALEIFGPDPEPWLLRTLFCTVLVDGCIRMHAAHTLSRSPHFFQVEILFSVSRRATAGSAAADAVAAALLSELRTSFRVAFGRFAKEIGRQRKAMER